MSEIQRNNKSPIMHRAVTYGDLLFLGGTIADDLTADMAGQTKQVLNKIFSELETWGSSKSNLISCTVYISDFSLKQQMSEVWVAEIGHENLPARATICVADLGENVLLEVVSIAAVGD